MKYAWFMIKIKLIWSKHLQSSLKHIVCDCLKCDVNLTHTYYQLPIIRKFKTFYCVYRVKEDLLFVVQITDKEQKGHVNILIKVTIIVNICFGYWLMASTLLWHNTNIPAWYENWLNWLGESVEVYHVMLPLPKNCSFLGKDNHGFSQGDKKLNSFSGEAA